MLNRRTACLLTALLALTPALAGTAAKPAYSDPAAEGVNRVAPATFDARFETTAGVFVIRVHRDWAPLGADRFYNLVDSGFYDGQKFFRKVEGFVVQWGIHGDPAVAAPWKVAQIDDDPVRQSNTTGRVTFANAGPGTRTTQLFINLADNTFLDDPRRMRGSVFAPFGEVVEGMDVVEELFGGYDEEPSRAQRQIQEQGNAFLESRFPKLDGVIASGVVAAGDPATASVEVETAPSD